MVGILLRNEDSWLFFDFNSALGESYLSRRNAYQKRSFAVSVTLLDRSSVVRWISGTSGYPVSGKNLNSLVERPRDREGPLVEDRTQQSDIRGLQVFLGLASGFTMRDVRLEYQDYSVCHAAEQHGFS